MWNGLNPQAMKARAARGKEAVEAARHRLLAAQRHLKEDKALARELTVGEAAQDALVF